MFRSQPTKETNRFKAQQQSFLAKIRRKSSKKKKKIPPTFSITSTSILKCLHPLQVGRTSGARLLLRFLFSC